MSTNNPPCIAGEMIRRLRSLKGIMQKEACKKMAITQQAYSKIELSKNVPEKKLAEILLAFNSSMQELESIIKFLPPPPPHHPLLQTQNNIVHGLNLLIAKRL